MAKKPKLTPEQAAGEADYEALCNPEEAWAPTCVAFMCPLCKAICRIWAPGGAWPPDSSYEGGPVCQGCDHEFKTVLEVEPFFSPGREQDFAAAKERMADPVVKPEPQGKLFD